MNDDPRVVVLVTPGCHLCEDACVVVADVCAAMSVDWESRQLGDCDEATRQRWREFVPVVLIDGEVHDVFRVTPERLQRAIGS